MFEIREIAVCIRKAWKLGVILWLLWAYLLLLHVYSSSRGWSGVCDLPRSHCNSSGVIGVGGYLLHHVAYAGHWQCCEAAHTHTRAHIHHCALILTRYPAPFQSKVSTEFITIALSAFRRWVGWNRWSQGWSTSSNSSTSTESSLPSSSSFPPSLYLSFV